jgi:hypothetical protein
MPYVPETISTYYINGKAVKGIQRAGKEMIEYATKESDSFVKERKSYRYSRIVWINEKLFCKPVLLTHFFLRWTNIVLIYIFVLIASKSVFPSCPRSAETTISHTPCFLLCKQKLGEIAL